MSPRPTGEPLPSVLKLSFYDSNGAMRSYETDAYTVIIGSHPDCHLVLPDIPPQACKIYLSEHGYYAVDLGGTLSVDGRPGSGFVTNGAALQVGPRTGFRVQIRTAPEPVRVADPAPLPVAPPPTPPPIPPVTASTPPPGRSEAGRSVIARPPVVSESPRTTPSPAPPQPASPSGGMAAAAGRPHHPGLALALGIVLPGAGQAYNGQPLKAALLALTSVLVLPWLFSLYEAWARARRVQADGGRRGSGGWGWVTLHLWFLLALGLAALIGLTLAGVLS